jgi:hypothetical protein
MIRRETLHDGTLRLRSADCTYDFARPRPGIVCLRITGRETGELGRAPLGEVAADAALHPPLRLLIDMSGLTHVAEAVSRDWTAWFRANQASVRRVDVLAPELFVRLVVAVSQLFSRTGDLIHIHTDAAHFSALVNEAAGHSAQGEATARGAGFQPARTGLF